AYRWFIILFVVALLCDALSTIHFMRREGHPDSEIHLAIRLIAQIFGPIIGPLIAFVGKAVCGLAVCIYLRRWALYIFTPVIVLSFWAAWYNIWGWQTGYIPNIFRIIPW
ncbi:MAG: hypothetical protein GY869_18380, partial [Planctomycetes bacterium]|nr:hypothetical protein [Planctomycetota bacterium]